MSDDGNVSPSLEAATGDEQAEPIDLTQTHGVRNISYCPRPIIRNIPLGPAFPPPDDRHAIHTNPADINQIRTGFIPPSSPFLTPHTGIHQFGLVNPLTLLVEDETSRPRPKPLPRSPNPDVRRLPVNNAPSPSPSPWVSVAPPHNEYLYPYHPHDHLPLYGGEFGPSLIPPTNLPYGYIANKTAFAYSNDFRTILPTTMSTVHPSVLREENGRRKRQKHQHRNDRSSSDDKEECGSNNNIKDNSTTTSQGSDSLPSTSTTIVNDGASMYRRAQVEARAKGQALSRPVPDELKDEAYWEYRRNNNESAKRSRDARRENAANTALRATFLADENVRLNIEINRLREEKCNLIYQLQHRSS